MTSLSVLLIVPTETSSSMSLLLHLRGYERRWELESTVTEGDVDKVDVVIVDAGYEFAKRLTHGKPKRPFVILISSESEPSFSQPGVDAHLVEPVDPATFTALMKRVCAFYAGLREVGKPREAFLPGFA